MKTGSTKYGPWSPEDTEILRQMAESGKSTVAIAARLHRNIEGVRREARRHGIVLKPVRRTFTLRELHDQVTAANRKF
ncbi:MAG: hypothetical protein P4M07_23975 [Xanthobacteraceae bacterium]|nr:hypothetical protein [Xanthobacteraceae bacterium]